MFWIFFYTTQSPTIAVEDNSKVFLVLVPEVELVSLTKVGRQIAQTFRLHEQCGEAKIGFLQKRIEQMLEILKLRTKRETVLFCHFLIKSIKVI